MMSSPWWRRWWGHHGGAGVEGLDKMMKSLGHVESEGSWASGSWLDAQRPELEDSRVGG